MTYPELLQKLKATHPAVADTLLAAYQNRVDHLNAYRNGVRFAGIEEWLQYLDGLRESLERTATVPKIAFLYERVRSDYVTALEATLSGYPSVTHDAMRDVMEVEFLVRDFAADFPRLAQWLAADKRDLQRNFQPVHLRERHAQRLGVEARQLPEAADYAGHSGVLHVNPHTPDLFRKGLVDAADTFRIDMCFWEMFQHARRLAFATFDLLSTPAFHGAHNPDPNVSLPSVAKAYERTQEMQQIFMALVVGASAEQEDI